MFLGAAGIDLNSGTILKAIPVLFAMATSILKFRDAMPRRRRAIETIHGDAKTDECEKARGQRPPRPVRYQVSRPDSKPK